MWPKLTGPAKRQPDCQTATLRDTEPEPERQPPGTRPGARAQEAAMYNRATAELAEQVKAWEARERGNNLSRSEMLQRQARRVRSEAAKTASFHGRVETWLTGKAADVEAGERPPSPSYQTKNHAAHHRFRDRDPSKELGPMRCDPRAACLPPPPFSRARCCGVCARACSLCMRTAIECRRSTIRSLAACTEPKVRTWRRHALP